jgi:hypothetical protein
MSDRGPNPDQMPVGGRPDEPDATYRDASYLGTSEDDEEEVQDLGFIVEDRRDERAMLTDGWQRLDDLDTDEPLETNRTGKIPGARQLREEGADDEWFATDYHVDHAAGEEQEADFAATSMLESDPDMNAGMDDFTDETLTELDGDPERVGIRGRAPGVVAGLGTSVPQDIGKGGFAIRDNPLMQPENRPISDERLSDEATGRRDVDDMGSDAELDALADRAAWVMEQRGDRGE